MRLTRTLRWYVVGALVAAGIGVALYDGDYDEVWLRPARDSARGRVDFVGRLRPDGSDLGDPFERKLRADFTQSSAASDGVARLRIDRWSAWMVRLRVGRHGDPWAYYDNVAWFEPTGERTVHDGHDWELYRRVPD